MTTFKRFEEDDIVRANPTEVTTGIWTGDTGSLTAFYTSSTQASSTSGQYYLNVYNINPSSSLAEVQFAVAYGHRDGGGAPSLALDSTATLCTKATYAQYRNLLLEPEDSYFTFAGGYNSDDVYVINVQRARLKESLDPGNWSLTLSGSGGSITLIDDSGQTLGATYGRSGAVFNVVKGTLTGASGSTITASTSSFSGSGYGLVYPSLGVIVLNPKALSTENAVVAANASTASLQSNHQKLFNSIVLGRNFAARSAETVSSTHYFVRLRNKEFNYSNNPTFYNETNGAIENTDFIRDPRVYPTTIGLYNDENELLAVAKLSRPVQKAFEKELLIRCRLDY